MEPNAQDKPLVPPSEEQWFALFKDIHEQLKHIANGVNARRLR
jgi:hypothetical protein